MGLFLQMAFNMQSVQTEVHNIINDDDNTSNCAVAGDSDINIDDDDVMEPPCIYHPNLKDLEESKKSWNEQFDRLKNSGLFEDILKKEDSVMVIGDLGQEIRL